MHVLTADVVGGVERSSDLGVHFDHLVVVLRHLAVTLFDALVDPVLEGFSYHSVDDVDQPLPWKPVLVSFVRQVVPHVCPFTCLFQDALDAERLVLWTEHHLHLVALDVLFLAGDQVLAEVLDYRSAEKGITYDGHRVVAAEPRLALHGQELELLPLALVLALPLGSGNANFAVVVDFAFAFALALTFAFPQNILQVDDLGVQMFRNHVSFQNHFLSIIKFSGCKQNPAFKHLCP